MLEDFTKFVGKRTDEKIQIEKYKRLLRENPNKQPTLHVKLGKLYEKIGDKKSAIHEYSMAARLYADAGDVNRAIAANKLIVRLDPTEKDALADLAYLQFQDGAKLTKQDYEDFLHEIEEMPKDQQNIEIRESQQTTTRDRGDKGTPQPQKTSLLDLAKKDANAADDIMGRLRQISLFSKLSHADLLQLKEHAIVWNCAENTLIMKADEEQQSLFIILDGNVNILEQKEEKQDSLLDTLEVGEFFGTTSFFGQYEMHLSAITGSSCTLLEVSGDVILSLAKKRAEMLGVLKKYCKRWVFYPTLAHVPLFKYLTTKEQQQIAENLALTRVKKGATIITEGEIDESIYLIKSGTVEVYTTLVEREEIQVLQAQQPQLYLATLKEGDFFGEGAFLTKEPRGATISALTDVQLLKLPKQYLENIIKTYPGVEMILQECYRQRTSDTMKVIQSTF